jgi:signal transduction histidine kinase
MVRLTGPEHLEGQLRRYKLSVAFALAAFLLSLFLTLTLTQSLRGQRAAQAKLVDELRRSEQLAALGKLLAGVAHEIRNPLAGIRSTIQLWQRTPGQAEISGSTDAILHATERLNELLTRLLHFARTEHVERHPVHVNDVVAETFKLMDAQAEVAPVSTGHCGIARR